MCGIVGIINIQADHGIAVIQRMLDSIVHRGPDDSGYQQVSNACIGMRRLAIIDLEGGHQPLCNEDGTIWVVNNGEIYNFQELTQTLKARGHLFRTASDTEVIVHAYEEFGDDFLQHLDGMFGLAIWDSNQRKLLLARDRLGIKPLYYAQVNNQLIFASELKAILACEKLEVSIDTDALQDYLALGYAIAPNTILSGIKKIKPGERLIWSEGSLKRSIYWKLSDEINYSRTRQQWVEEIQAQLKRSVCTHLMSDVPLGAFLSGGIDSSAIVALMNDELSVPVNTYSIGYKGDSTSEYYNELPFAKQIADAYDTDHREISVRPIVAELLPKLMWHLEEPVSDTATTTTYLVSRLARESVTVIMSGVGGDELFAGYRRYLGNHYGRRMAMLPRWLRSGLIQPIGELLPSGRNSRLLDLSRYAKQFIRSSNSSWDAQYKSYIQIGDPSRFQNFTRESLQLPDSYDQLVQGITSRDPLQQLMNIDIRSQLPESLLLLTDKMTMAPSLECRVPYLDHHLVELAGKIPAEMKIRNGNLKGLLKDALAEKLPDNIIRRKKRGFGAPVGSWLQKELKPLRSYLLNREAVERRGLLAWPAVKNICSLHDKKREDYTDLIMVLMNVELWSRLFLDNQRSEDITSELSEVVSTGTYQ